MEAIKYCLNCGDHLELTPGRRAKNYCSNNCKQRHWQKMKKEGVKLVVAAPKTKKVTTTAKKKEPAVNQPKTAVMSDIEKMIQESIQNELKSKK